MYAKVVTSGSHVGRCLGNTLSRINDNTFQVVGAIILLAAMVYLLFFLVIGDLFRGDPLHYLRIAWSSFF